MQLPMCFPRHKSGSIQCKKSPSLVANLHVRATEHVSGYHMAVVAGMIFFAVRAVFALLPAFSNRRPIKKWAALAALRRRGILPSAFGRRGCDPTLLHHGRYCAHRRHGRSPDAHVPHAHGGGVGRAAAGAGSHRASELPDVVCRDAGAGRRLSAWTALDEPAAARRRSPRTSRSGADARSPACCWFRCSPAPRPFPSSPIISTASRPMA